MSDLADTLFYITNDAQQAELDRIIDVVRARQKTLGELRAARVVVGSEVETNGLRPKYLNNLIGTVEDVKGKYATLRITDPASVAQIVGTKYGPAYGTTEHVMRGMPLSCLSVKS